jgi:hypothetical protein
VGASGPLATPLIPTWKDFFKQRQRLVMTQRAVSIPVSIVTLFVGIGAVLSMPAGDMAVPPEPGKAPVVDPIILASGGAIVAAIGSYFATGITVRTLWRVLNSEKARQFDQVRHPQTFFMYAECVF